VSYWAKLAISYSKSLNQLLWGIMIVCFTISFFVFSKKHNLLVFDTELESVYSIIPIIAFSFFHYLIARRFVHCLRLFWKIASPHNSLDLFINLTTETGIFTRELEPVLSTRVKFAKFGEDVATWVIYLFFFGILWLSSGMSIFFLITKFCSYTHIAVVCGIFSGFAVGLFNWFIASQWIIAISELTYKDRSEVMLLSQEKPIFVAP
jgi:hypothetical protein